MSKYRKWLLGGFAALLFGSLAWAQTLVTQSLTGNEIVLFQTVGPGGTGGFTTVNALRNATTYAFVPTGTTVSTTITPTVAKLLASGAITTWNITLPTTPFDGQMLEIACPGGTASTVAVTAGALPAGTGILGTAFTGCTAGGAAANTAEFIYSVTTNNWNRIQ